MPQDQQDPNLQDSAFRQLALHETAKMNQNIQALMFIAQLWWLGVRLHCYPGWIMLRCGFGERFLPTRIIVSTAVAMVLVSFLSGSSLGLMLSLLVFGVACGHRVHIMRRNKRDDIWLSYFDGVSYLTNKLPKHNATIENYMEPAIMAALGLLFIALAAAGGPDHGSSTQFYWSYGMGFYLVTVGLAMFLQANKNKRDARNLLLDARDSQIVNEMFAKQQDRDRDRSDSEGFTGEFSAVRPA